ncbi:DHA1 family bicyclomycin/chloramphenicol resistance-like MFS transporter [Paenibacillus castaneae]|uniref:multidrug effflux MFS transporter n=1 Tax=Paenibacillus castaneae TaxID=474957 RepID=UPI001FD53D22|nr:multidrug effflux MFS transporter [Paenibacillus castaneae]NIK77207.1 DHA1 family bicyclomycin/chloramphenicol resistance-like MFS transporter [Paenibacillus castaneae]
MPNLSRIQSIKAYQSTGLQRIWLIILLGSLSAFGPLSLDMYLPALPKLAVDLNTSSSLVQLSLTACMIGLSFGQLFAGTWSDIRGRRFPLLIFIAIYGLSSVLCAFAPSIGVLIALRFIQGFSGSAGIVISRAVVRDMYSGPDLTKFFAMLMLVNGAAPIFAPIAGGQLLKFTSWEGVFIVLALWGVLIFLAVLFGLPETLAPEKRMTGGLRQTLSTFAILLRDRTFMGYALAQGLVMAAMFAYIAGSPFVLQNLYGVTPQSFSLLFAINGLGIIIFSQTAGRLASKVGEKKLFVVGLALASTGGTLLLIMIMLKAALIAILIPLFFVVSSVGIISATGFSLAMQAHGHAAGSASALLGLMSFTFGGIMAPLVGLGGSANALPMGIWIVIAELGAVLCYIFMIRKKTVKK